MVKERSYEINILDALQPTSINRNGKVLLKDINWKYNALSKTIIIYLGKGKIGEEKLEIVSVMK